MNIWWCRLIDKVQAIMDVTSSDILVKYSHKLYNHNANENMFILVVILMLNFSSNYPWQTENLLILEGM